ncbi:MAG: glycoside hydrolase family 95 protein, partial [Gammaproteobacteria bacterium]|nr:glycoside hydrolase family 95 protein [Gammaproteobacteria bacterium]
SWRLWYRQPAKRWLDSLPVGNGRLGAMVFGSPERNVIALNESTVWSGGPSASGVNPLGRQHLGEIRKLLFQGESVRANELSERYLTGRESSYGTHLPLANLVITATRQRGSEVKNFRRSLDLDTGIAKTEYEWAGARYRTEVFASNPDDVIVLRLSADQPAGLSFSFSLDPGELPGEVSVHGTDTLILGGSAWERRHSNGSTGVNFQAWVRAIAQGGRISGKGDRIEIQRADSVVLLIAAHTSYVVSDLFDACERQLKEAAVRPFETLLNRHVADHRRLFGRVHIDLGGSDDGARATDDRLAAVKRGASDPHLAALFFQYGRYLLIAGSRENSPLPMNLQGIWNDGLAAKMQWTCDFHLDINTQQNYWPSEVCNLSECGEPLFRLLEKLATDGRKTAAELYGARGWVCHVYTNAWGFTAPGR